MNAKKALVGLVLWACWAMLPAQSVPLNKYRQYIKEGQSDMEAFKYGEAIDWFTAAATILPDSQAVANAWIARAENEQTFQLLRYSSELDSLVKSARQEKTEIQYNSLLSLGRAEMAQANYQRAEELFEQAFSFCKERADTLDNNCEQANIALAETRQKQALASNFQNLINEGNDHFINDRPWEAMEQYEAALQLGFNNRKARERLEVLRLKYGSLEEAVDTSSLPNSENFKPQNNGLSVFESFKIDGRLEIVDGGVFFLQKTRPSDAPQGLQVVVADGALVITYPGAGVLLPENDFTFELTAHFEGRQILIPTYQITNYFSGQRSESVNIIWHNFLESLPDATGHLIIEIKNIIRAPMLLIDCNDSRPTWNTREAAPQMLSAGAGFLLIGAGFIVRGNSNILFEEYDQNNNEGTLDRANRLERSATALRTVGSALFTASTAWGIFRYLKYKKNAQLYDRYCSPRRLSFNLSSTFNGIYVSPSIQVTYQF